MVERCEQDAVNRAGPNASGRKVPMACCASKTRPSRMSPLGPAVRERAVAFDAGRSAGRGHRRDGSDAMYKAAGISVSSVQRIWRAHGLQPHRVRQFKLSRDRSSRQVNDIVGLHVDPPAHAVVLSVDEKSQIQGLDRTQPGLPLKPGRWCTMTHDYKRHGTTTLFAALNVLEGEHRSLHVQRHRHQEFIRFLNAIEADIPEGKIVHVVLDNYATYKHPKVRSLAGSASALRLPLHPDFLLLAQCRRGLLRQADPKPDQTRRVPVDRRPPGRHQPLSTARPTTNPSRLFWTADPDQIIAAVRRGYQALDLDPLALIRAIAHKNEAGLQLADVVAGAFYEAVCVDGQRVCEPSRAELLFPRLYRGARGQILGYGVKPMPMPWKMQLTLEQRAFFESPGFPGKGGRCPATLIRRDFHDCRP